MAGISATDVKALRDSTGAGMMDCKRALSDAEGDVERAVELLRERGLAKAGKRAGRETSEGAIVFSATKGRGALVELGCETDFVAKTPEFQGLAQGVAEALATTGGVDELDAALKVPMEGGSVDDVIKAAVARVGENIQLKRVASVEVDGIVGGYVHGPGKLGVLVGLETGSAEVETAAQEIAKDIAKDIAMHVAAHDPTPVAVDRENMPEALVAKERAFLKQQALESGKPENVVEKMVDGRLNKFFAEQCLLEQGFVKDPDKSVRTVLAEAGKAAGGEIRVTRFVRFKLGEAVSE